MLVLFLAPRGFSPGTRSGFSPSSKINVVKFQFDLDKPLARVIAQALRHLTSNIDIWHHITSSHWPFHEHNHVVLRSLSLRYWFPCALHDTTYPHVIISTSGISKIWLSWTSSNSQRGLKLLPILSPFNQQLKRQKSRKQANKQTDKQNLVKSLDS